MLPYVWRWLPEFAIFDLKIGFLIKNSQYFTPGMYWKPPQIRFFHCFSEGNLLFCRFGASKNEAKIDSKTHLKKTSQKNPHTSILANILDSPNPKN